MKKLRIWFILFLFSLVVLFSSCNKDSFITSASAFIGLSADSLHFDTVFTSVGSVTQLLKVYNFNDQKLRINKIELGGGAASAFQINVNGMPGPSLSGIDIAANDSIYIFVSVTVDPNQNNLPFIVQDSILINYNGNDVFVRLDAYGRNAHFLKNFIVSDDTVFTSDLPIVVLGSLTVNQGATLTINKGSEIFCHLDAAVIIFGTLKANGEKAPGLQVTFSGDRLDEPYKSLPGSWRGIIFSETSSDNELSSTIIKNAFRGIFLQGTGSPASQLKLKACTITNNSMEGIKAINSDVHAENCLISNCGLNNVSLSSGNYDFINCTLVSYSYALLDHEAPTLLLSDTIGNSQTALLSASFINDIFFGESGLVSDEIQLFQAGSDFNVLFNHVLYKATALPESLFQNSVNGADPGFVRIDAEHGIFDFHLMPGSVCVDAGEAVAITTDLDGNPRTVGTAPDLGCYELE